MNEESSTDSARRRRRLVVCWSTLPALAILALLAFVIWRALLPENPPSATGGLTQQDKREIASACRWHTIRLAMHRLRNAEFSWFFRSTRVLFQQKIDRFMDDHDGTYRVYVVTYDKRDPDGFVPWSRHQFTHTNGHWTILRSY